MFRVLGLEYLGRTDLAHVVDETPTGTLVRHTFPVGKEHKLENGGVKAVASAASPTARPRSEVVTADAGLSGQTKKFSGDAPACDNCGHITVRNGTCYKCLNCGSSMGCS